MWASTPTASKRTRGKPYARGGIGVERFRTREYSADSSLIPQAQGHGSLVCRVRAMPADEEHAPASSTTLWLRASSERTCPITDMESTGRASCLMLRRSPWRASAFLSTAAATVQRCSSPPAFCLLLSLPKDRAGELLLPFLAALASCPSCATLRTRSIPALRPEGCRGTMNSAPSTLSIHTTTG